MKLYFTFLIAPQRPKDEEFLHDLIVAMRRRRREF
jgi:hypothetical protein